MNIQKTKIECYRIREAHGNNWADIFIDGYGTRGRILIASAYGSWQNYWGACGHPFNQFLQQLNLEYAAGKFKADQHFDQHSTIQSYREAIKDYEDREVITRSTALKLYGECTQLEVYLQQSEFRLALYHQKGLMDLFDHTPELRYCITPGFKMFWENLWPFFIQRLAEESHAVQECDATKPP